MPDPVSPGQFVRSGVPARPDGGAFGPERPWARQGRPRPTGLALKGRGARPSSRLGRTAGMAVLSVGSAADERGNRAGSFKDPLSRLGGALRPPPHRPWRETRR